MSSRTPTYEQSCFARAEKRVKGSAHKWKATCRLVEAKIPATRACQCRTRVSALGIQVVLCAIRAFGLTRAKSASLSIIHVLGDSMEPTLSDGDEVLVDASDQGLRLRDGIYVLRADDALVVKRVTLKPGGRKITISSDNSAYPSWDDVDRSEIQVVGRVIWFGRAV